jgi:protein-tyrosine phosphatase
MIDIHCHFLPGIDDGPSTLEGSLALARLAVKNGITHSVVTPHIHAGRWENSSSIIKTIALDFKRAVLEHEIPLQIGVAAEVRIGAEIVEQINRRRIPFLGSWGDKKVMLLEMPHSHIPLGIESLVSWLMKRNILPLIAHPERNKDVHRQPQKLERLIAMGCLFQLTASSVAGQFGEVSRLRAVELLERGVVTVLATDAHNIKHRPPDLRRGRDVAAKIVGIDEAYRLVLDNPWKIVGEQFGDLG